MRERYTQSVKAAVDEAFIDRFAEQFIVDLNPGPALKRAGWTGAGSGSTRAGVLLARADVQAAIAAKMAARSARTGITADRVLEELAKLGFSNMGDYMTIGPDGGPLLNFKDLTRDQMAALTEVTVDDYVDGRGEEARDVKRVKFKLSDKRAALVDMGKHLGMFVERSQVEVKVSLEDLILQGIKGGGEKT